MLFTIQFIFITIIVERSLDMLNKLNKFLYSSIIISIIMFIIGLIFIIYPEVSFTTITYTLSILLIVNGIYFLIEKESSIFFSSFLTLGVVELLLGIIMLVNPDIVKTLFPIVAGIIMITKSTLDLRLSILLYRNNINSWLSLLICSIISIICGLIIILNPSIGTIALTTSLGILITVYSISNIIDTIIFKNNIKEITKLLEK